MKTISVLRDKEDVQRHIRIQIRDYRIQRQLYHQTRKEAPRKSRNYKKDPGLHALHPQRRTPPPAKTGAQRSRSPDPEKPHR